MASRRILIVDDQKEVSSVLRSGLESLGQDIRVTELFSGEEAVLETHNDSLDLLVSDVLLPGINGFDLMEKLKSKNPDLKVILVSGVTDKKIRREVAEAGADAFFFKPIEMADFLDGVERVLGLVNTMLPSELDIEKQEAVQQKDETISLSERIASLRQELDASCVYLMNDLGQVLVRAGEMPDREIETKLAADLMALIFTNNRVSSFLGGHSSKNFTFFHGKNFDLTISPIGRMYALLMATNRSPSTPVDQITRSMSAAIKDIFSTLSILGLTAGIGNTGQLSKNTTGSLIDPELESMFEKAKSTKIKKEEIESFWETLPDIQVVENIAGGQSLSFEEAAELGLAPSEDDD
jgi:CheY-like chemotaxis protein